MSNNAVVWIRDGVLVDRMHINPVVFAVSVWVFTTPERRRNTTLEGLINFGFEKSGLSCADKMRLYNAGREDVLMDVGKAASYYNVLASEAATAADYFTGAIELLRDLQSAGVQNFITSAVEQDVLDAWSHSKQGLMIAPYLKEILGKRHDFSKGKDHFEYISRRLRNQKIYYVADAMPEIRTGREYSAAYNIIPVGFANVITADRVSEAVKLVSRALKECAGVPVPFPATAEQLHVEAERLKLPAQNEIDAGLRVAGAEIVISDTSKRIMKNLRAYFEERSMF